jgi:hypothetical protein
MGNLKSGLKLVTTAAAILCCGTYQLEAQAPTQPTVPQKTVNIGLPAQGTSTCPSLIGGSNCIRNVPAGNASSLRSAINAAKCGDTIVVAAGSIYNGNFNIPATSCTGWIVVESSAVAKLPSPGHRVGPSLVSNMATLVTNAANTPAISIADNAHNWRFIGLEITAAVGSAQNALFTAGGSTTALENIPTEIIVDRCYFHGATTTSIRRALGFHVAYGAVVDSYIGNIFSPGFDSQAIAAWNGPGPYLYQNNFLSAASENTLFGGADPTIPNVIPSDITIVGNWYWKDYQNWKGAGYGVKNSMEFKSARRVMVDGNVFDYSWADGQTGNLVSMKSVNQGGACTWCSTTDITFTHNIVRHGAIGILLGLNDGTGAPQLNRILIQNNVLTDISSAYASGGNGYGLETLSATNGSGLLTSNNETINHNSVFADVMFLVLGDSGRIANYQLTNNIGTYGQYGIKGAGQSPGTASLGAYVPNAVYGANMLLAPGGTFSLSAYPSGTSSGTVSAAGFTNYSAANYQLSAASPYHNAGTDGKDIGVWDWACLTNSTTAALAGTYVPGSACAHSFSSLVQPPTALAAVVQ